MHLHPFFPCASSLSRLGVSRWMRLRFGGRPHITEARRKLLSSFSFFVYLPPVFRCSFLLGGRRRCGEPGFSFRLLLHGPISFLHCTRVLLPAPSTVRLTKVEYGAFPFSGSFDLLTALLFLAFPGGINVSCQGTVRLCGWARIVARVFFGPLLRLLLEIGRAADTHWPLPLGVIRSGESFFPSGRFNCFFLLLRLQLGSWRTMEGIGTRAVAPQRGCFPFSFGTTKDFSSLWARA